MKLNGSQLQTLHCRLKAWCKQLLAEHFSPHKLAAAAFVGAVIGCTPFFGLHLPICLAFAYLLRLNKVTVYAAANISIPPLVPFIAIASIETGNRLLYGHWLGLTLDGVRHLPPATLAGRFLLDWLVGSLVVGAAVGAIMSLAVYSISSYLIRLAHDPVRCAIRQASSSYCSVSRKLRGYVWFKYRLDPCYRIIAWLVPDSTLTVDLGTGLGMLPLVLVMLPGTRQAIGVEWDHHKITAGKQAAAGLDAVTLIEGDLRSYDLPACDVVTMVDVLHYYSPEVQREILRRSAAALKPGGKIFIREADAEAKRGARWTRALERLAVKWGWNRGAGSTKFRPITDLIADLKALDLAVSTHAASGKLHPGNLLIEARRPAGALSD